MFAVHAGAARRQRRSGARSRASVDGSARGGAGGLAVLIGSPVAHSLSPAIHRAAFAAAGVDWSYAALEVAPGSGGEAVEAMRLLGIGGMSVTMPHKTDVADAVDELEPAARSLRSVNTVSWDGERAGRVEHRRRRIRRLVGRGRHRRRRRHGSP